MAKTKGVDSSGNQTIRFMSGNNVYELGVVNGEFVLYTNGVITHDLGDIEDSIAANAVSLALKADAASPVFTGITTMALPIYANDAAAKTDGLTAGQLYQVTTTGVVQVVLAA